MSALKLPLIYILTLQGTLDFKHYYNLTLRRIKQTPMIAVQLPLIYQKERMKVNFYTLNVFLDPQSFDFP